MESTSSGIGITINERLLQKHTNADTLLFVSVLCVCEKWRWQWRFAGFHLQLISLFALSSMRVPSTTRFFLSLGLLLLLLLPSSCYDLHSPPVFYSFFFRLFVVVFAWWSCLRQGATRSYSKSIAMNNFTFFLKVSFIHDLVKKILRLCSGRSSWMLHLRSLILRLLILLSLRKLGNGRYT